MERFRSLLGGGMSLGGAAPGTDNTNLIDNSETVHISSLALLKMLRHGRAGVPMEVMGLMLGEFVDDFTVRVVDVFAMPQSGTGVSVEAVDPVFQMKMMDMLRQTGRPESVVGWYHSHPGFGCWLSSVDINTQQSFEQLTPRAVAVVVDPIQSVKGKVVIDAFRLINPQSLMMGQEPRQTTSNLGHLNKPSIQALIHGLNRHYYSIGINYRKTALEENMLMNLHKHPWTDALQMEDFRTEGQRTKDRLERLVSLAEGYEKRVKEETELTKDQLKTRYVGKLDPKKHLEDVGQQLIEDNIVAVSRQMIDKEATMAKKDAPAGSNGQPNGDQMEPTITITDTSGDRDDRKPTPSSPTPPLSTAPLTPETLKILLDTFDQAFSHTHYAVCGHAALMVWGYRPAASADMPSHVSILCPAEGRQAILTWARTVGWGGGGGGEGEGEGGKGGEVIGVPLHGSAPQVVVGFRIRTVESGEVWERLRMARPMGMRAPYVGSVGEMMRTEARVVAVPTLLDEFARAWYFCVVKGGGGGGKRERHIAELVLWILGRLARDVGRYRGRARWRLTPESVPTVVYWKFWDAFVGEHHEALGLLETCGLRRLGVAVQNGASMVVAGDTARGSASSPPG
ncbi:hypothetical protein C8A01DRAFT_18289 [Parachaetomium inaequale]|uniref:MPN domain-containing protein n=1 Tax=Parachaetomium inaequale TaxID=2588326 RepID=A0AAN6SPQ4_9PEZI|nr:hypothetical protein C8A01DRAFT_18289 [Parachaetomium inaequale]